MRISVSTVDPKDVSRILSTVPEWFGRPESNQEYIETTQNFPCWVAQCENTVIGVATIKKHYTSSWEIYFMVVDRDFHRQGVGHQMLAEIEIAAQKSKAKLLQVKTLGESPSDPYYAKTRSFYLAQGFIP